MATRCNIKITDGRDVYYLYRHWDGYLAETGAHVLEVAEVAENIKDFNRGIWAVNKFFRYMREGYDGEQKSHYELTDNVHGDIERFYHLWFRYEGVVIEYAEGYGPEIEIEVKPYNIEEFRAMINKERTDSNKWLETAKKTPGYEDYEFYPMV